jgi:choline-glycine betaine transporter
VLRSIAISGALPFTVIMIIQVACLFRSLSAESVPESKPIAGSPIPAKKEVAS